eukprot:scaffold650377_cov45-Prasinocladus_malaysianus.AAC.1
MDQQILGLPVPSGLQVETLHTHNDLPRLKPSHRADKRNLSDEAAVGRPGVLRAGAAAGGGRDARGVQGKAEAL